MPRLVLFVPALLPHTMKLIDSLRFHGYDVAVFLLHRNRAHYPWAENCSAEGECFEGRKLSALVKIARQARKSDLVIITGWHSWLQVAAAIWCFVTRRRFAYWLDVPEGTGPWHKKMVKKYLLRLSKACFITSKSGFSFFTEAYGVNPAKCHRFPYLSAFDPYLDQAECLALEGENHSSAQVIKVLIANRFLPRKGYETVYRALQALPEDAAHRLEIKVLGHGYENSNAGKKISSLSNSKMLGWVEFDEYLRNVKACDVYLHASDHEPYGIPPMDAMALGKVVICSEGVFSSLDCINDNENGFLFRPGDHERLTAIFANVIANPDDLKKIGRRARATEEIPSFEDNLAAIAAIIR